jgi:hypothetical protein
MLTNYRRLPQDRAENNVGFGQLCGYSGWRRSYLPLGFPTNRSSVTLLHVDQTSVAEFLCIEHKALPRLERSNRFEQGLVRRQTIYPARHLPADTLR